MREGRGGHENQPRSRAEKGWASPGLLKHETEYGNREERDPRNDHQSASEIERDPF
jgi:hypothetical protein